MKKYVFFCVLVLMAVAASAQRKPATATKKSVVHLIQSQSAQGINRNDVIKVYKGTFQQEYSKLSSDSAYFNQAANSFDAFGHVVINQGDTLNIYADKLNYNGNTHVALLTDNVRMVDKDATLTTNYLTYNTATRVGTYTGGGKLVNKTNTLTSKNGYYYAFTRDSYFRYNVVLVTNDALIKTDTLRYNSGSRIAYFYGPTHIYGHKNKDTLYTENGTYNTITEQAFFGKKNLYSQGTKTLKGDSLFYDRLKGYGRAVKNITFNDNEQKITMKGDLGTYYNADGRTVVTKNAYVILVTEQQDSTKTDSVTEKPALKDSAKAVVKTANTSAKDSVKTAKVISKGADKTVKATEVKKEVPVVSAQLKSPAIKPKKQAGPKPVVKPIADTIAAKGKPRTKLDSVYIAADTLETQILTFKDLKIRQENMRPNKLRDSLAKIARERKLPLYTQSTAKHIYPAPMLGVPPDTSLLASRMFFGKPKIKAADTTQQKKLLTKGGKKLPVAKPQQPAAPDSVYMSMGYKVQLSDTARVRILTGHHHALLYKSDLQAKADSMFYSYSDSVLRCYVRPMIWTQGSQLSGDTVYLQMKNRKLNNMELFPNAFVVNIEDKDSTHFNQVAGKRMRGFFVNNKMSQMYVDGNAESIYFARDSGKVNEMSRSISSRIKVNFKDNKVTGVLWLVKPDYRYGPLSQFKEDDKVLKGFIWKPKERPISKEYVITAYSRRQTEARLAARKQAKSPPGAKPATGGGKPGKTAADATAVNKGTPAKTADSLKASITAAAVDSTAHHAPLPPVKAPKDSTGTKKSTPAP